MCCITVNILIFYIKKKIFQGPFKSGRNKNFSSTFLTQISNTCEMSVSCKIYSKVLRKLYTIIKNVKNQSMKNIPRLSISISPKTQQLKS